MRTLVGKSHWLFVLSFCLLAAACGGDDKDETPPDSGSDFTGDDEDDAGKDDEGDDKDDAGTEEDAGETLTASKEEAKAKGWVEGCFKKPEGNAELLNSCGTGFRTFDKTLYPSSWKEGGPLPTLP